MTAEEQKREELKFIDPPIHNGLLNNTGVIFGKKGYNTVAKLEDMDGHILVVGGVGSGKSSCIAIPSLQAWNNRVFAIDIKGELLKNTKHKRQNIQVFNPLDNNAWGFNPFHALKYTDEKYKAREARTIANSLIPMPPKIKETFWIDSARNLLTGAVLHYSSLGYSFIQTVKQILSLSPSNLINEIIRDRKSDKVLYFLSTFLDMAKDKDSKTLGSIYAELSRHIVLYVTDDDIENCLSKNKYIAPEDLEVSDIYVTIHEYLLDDWKNLLSLMISQFLTYFEQRKENTSTPILFLLDEFARLGKIEKMTNALSTLRSKKITICLIIQSLAQLDLIYEKETRNVMCDTCAYKAILGANDPDTQEVFSKLVGTYDKQVKMSGTNMGFGLPSWNTGTRPEDKRIIKPEEFSILNHIVLLTPYGFFRVEKTPWYLD